MRVAIASGKGGTGKTTLATSFAALLAGRGVAVRLLDCDVEEPDCHLFLHPAIERREPVLVPIPVVDDDLCTKCGLCGEVCAFKAITVIGTTVLVFPELCHACGACSLLCPEGAIREEGRETGVVEQGVVALEGRREFGLVTGVMAVGEAKAVPTVQAVIATCGGTAGDVHGADTTGDDTADGIVIIDAPPGTSCPVIASVRGADVVVLITEPTPFGLHDLKLAVEMVDALGLPAVVAVNRVGLGDDRVHRFCAEKGREIVLELPDDRRVAEAYARGDLVVDAVPELSELLGDAWERIVAAARRARASRR